MTGTRQESRGRRRRWQRCGRRAFRVRGLIGGCGCLRCRASRRPKMPVTFQSISFALPNKTESIRRREFRLRRGQPAYELSAIGWGVFEVILCKKAEIVVDLDHNPSDCGSAALEFRGKGRVEFSVILKPVLLLRLDKPDRFVGFVVGESDFDARDVLWEIQFSDDLGDAFAGVHWVGRRVPVILRSGNYDAGMSRVLPHAAVPFPFPSPLSLLKNRSKIVYRRLEGMPV